MKLAKLSPIAVLMIFACLEHGVQALAQQTQQTKTFQHRPVPVEHLYWHFLVYVHTLDMKSAELDAQGKNGSGLRNDLQHRMRFSDEDFALIRVSSQRLASKLGGLNEQAKAIRAAGPSASGQAQMKALVTQRDGYVNSEISSLRQTLSLEKRASLEAFLVQFFAPKPVTVTTSLPAVPPSRKEAQQ